MQQKRGCGTIRETAITQKSVIRKFDSLDSSAFGLVIEGVLNFVIRDKEEM